MPCCCAGISSAAPFNAAAFAITCTYSAFVTDHGKHRGSHLIESKHEAISLDEPARHAHGTTRHAQHCIG